MARKPCKLYPGNIAPNGYGRFKRDGQSHYAHRDAYEKAHGPIPAGMCVCHDCDVRACIEPSHLFLGTRGDNNRDRASKGRSATGSRNGRAKLTAAQTAAIRADTRPATHVAKDYPINDRRVHQIRNG